MYPDCEIEIPDVRGKINQVKKVLQHISDMLVEEYIMQTKSTIF